MKIEIKKANEKDLKKLNLYIPYKGVPDFHKEKIKEQQTGDNLWLITWTNKRPIAHVQLRFRGSKNKKIKRTIQNCGHIESLGVSEKYRKKGIATKLIKKCEELAKKRGLKKIGCSVSLKNNPMRDLCKKQEYKESKIGKITESWKTRKGIERETCTYLIKKLRF